ncbi:NAD-dependent epimerase/dehydratase family protein [Roseateles amylovorans]|uniref:NAD-dependent epimerase/dehydratase family protein n=1 Tax=Roseateles amylovorans TaxID=2978473 RepID=A0ABY6AYY0_9BURK|nr:NAD-dependent epimerase/dehydratase family protein [Roseateles amylovorans]UXH76280.1 NAD-dependent epimerase/dehydratase family protein [Roseateles amylovorans]
MSVTNPAPLFRLSRSRRERLLIVGCGDVGLRVLRLLGQRWTVLALTSSAARAEALRAAGAIPLVGNLDDPASLGRLAGLADRVLHLAPPATQGRTDERTRHLLQALSRSAAPRRLVYASTSGVYGDCGGARIDETRAVNPSNDRAWRRVDAEDQLRQWGRVVGCAVTVLRVPGIYAYNREGGHPRERLAKGLPVLRQEDDVFTNHIQADDLARACLLALMRGPSQVMHASDDSEMRMGDYFDLAASVCGMAPPGRIARAEAATVFSPMQMSFMNESRRLDNRRLKRALRLRLRYPTPADGLLAVEP